MQVLSASPAELRVPSRRHDGLREVDAGATRRILVVESIGYRVPQTQCTGRIHSVFARACNLACDLPSDGTLLTLCSSTAADGPTTLRLAGGAPLDLRDLFDRGERFTGRHGVARTPRVELRWRHAVTWQPSAPGPPLPRARIDANLRRAAQHLARHRCTRTNVIDCQAAPVIAALCDACGALDPGAAQRQVARLVGWGEGLTPAGDDFLVGLLAGLDGWPHRDEPRHRFRDALASAITAQLHRTTEIAAHFLRLAADGHFAAPLIGLCQALLGDDDDERVDHSLGAALAIGATSGADAVSGLFAGLGAWMALQPDTMVNRR
jgi:hypothetical protein